MHHRTIESVMSVGSELPPQLKSQIHSIMIHERTTQATPKPWTK